MDDASLVADLLEKASDGVLSKEKMMYLGDSPAARPALKVYKYAPLPAEGGICMQPHTDPVR